MLYKAMKKHVVAGCECGGWGRWWGGVMWARAAGRMGGGRGRCVEEGGGASQLTKACRIHS